MPIKLEIDESQVEDEQAYPITVTLQHLTEEEAELPQFGPHASGLHRSNMCVDSARSADDAASPTTSSTPSPGRAPTPATPRSCGRSTSLDATARVLGSASSSALLSRASRRTSTGAFWCVHRLHASTHGAGRDPDHGLPRHPLSMRNPLSERRIDHDHSS